MSKGKVSKNSRTSKTTVNVVAKTVKPKKETIMVEITAEVRAELEKDSKFINGKEILGTKTRYGKKYLLVKNT